jgi:hypothetical protein
MATYHASRVAWIEMESATALAAVGDAEALTWTSRYTVRGVAVLGVCGHKGTDVVGAPRRARVLV